MPVPVVVGAAAAIAARLAARKLAQEAAKKAAPRVVGGITGKGASKINPVYKETGIEKRALKAANSPVSPGNKGIGGPNVRNAIISGKPANPNVTRGGSMRSKLGWDWNK